MVEKITEFSGEDPERKASAFIDSLNVIKKSIEEISALESDWTAELDNRISSIKSIVLDEGIGTNSYKNHLTEKIDYAVKSGLLAVAGPEYILDECSININDKKFGFLDPENAKEAEERALRKNYHAKYSVPQLQKEHENKLLNWVNDFKSKYNMDPILENSEK